MNLVRSFRLSTYLTLGMACLCLGYGEGDLLPESPYITAAVLVVLVVAYRAEGRWSLSLRAANTVGAALFLVLVAWVAYQITRGTRMFVEQLPFPASMLPYLGPVLLILVPAKLFRPKHTGDFWAMQGIGVLAVALGCAMANDMFFGVLLVAYFFCFTWSLSLFYLYREIRPENMPVEAARRLSFPGAPRRWALVAATAAVTLFLLTPRPNDSKWQLPMAARGKMETGAPDGNLDLNRTGTLEQNNELAFEVYADDFSGKPKLDLNPTQRWRTAVLIHYEGGKWLRDPIRTAGLYVIDRTKPYPRRIPAQGENLRLPSVRNSCLPDFGPGAFYLSFKPRITAAIANVLADPVQWRPNDFPPVLVYGTRPGPVQQRTDGTFEWLGGASNNNATHTQILTALAQPDLGPPLNVASSYQDFLTRLPPQPTADRLRAWTADLLQRLVREGKLSADTLAHLDPFTRQPLPKYHEIIARALETYLSRSGEFTYTFDLQRQDRNIDPVEDFLFNTKAGHCQRFATALTLMLRSQGIPAQLVLGFRGCEPRADSPGWYEVRQSQAHAWVEVLVQRSPPITILPLRPGELPPNHGGVSFHLLSLDPTPTGEPSSGTSNTGDSWWDDLMTKGQAFFRHFVLAYDSAVREEAISAVIDTLHDFGESIVEGRISPPVAIAGGCLLVLGSFGIYRRRRRRRLAAEALATGTTAELVAPFHARLLGLLARHGHQPQPGETAREFAVRTGRALADDRFTAPAASVPQFIADAYYRVRFGDYSLSVEVLAKLDDALAHLETCLSRVVPAISAI
jgi:hypothetical protein